jgi:hypothetical protein
MSQAQLLQIAQELTLLDEDEVNFILAQYLKNRALEAQNTKKKKKTLPPHIKKAIGESLEAYERGEYTTLATDQDIDKYLENLVA